MSLSKTQNSRKRSFGAEKKSSPYVLSCTRVRGSFRLSDILDIVDNFITLTKPIGKPSGKRTGYCYPKGYFGIVDRCNFCSLIDKNRIKIKKI